MERSLMPTSLPLTVGWGSGLLGRGQAEEEGVDRILDRIVSWSFSCAERASI
jgi:hypothetical protein